MPSSRSKCDLKYFEDIVWEPKYLKKKCKELGVDGEFNAYQIRLFRSYVRVFFMFHITVTIIHCLLVILLSEHKKYIFYDVGIYSVSCLILLLILSINFRKKIIEKYTWIMFVSSALASLTLVCADLTQCLFHYYYHDWLCGSFYDTYILFMIYTFLPIKSLSAAFVLALVVSSAYIMYFMQIVYLPKGIYASMSSDIALHLCLNVVGILYRTVNDMIVRSSFIDRHQFIKEEISLRNAQRQEKILLDSILPSTFSELLQKDIKKKIIQSQRLASTPMQISNAFRRSMAIQIHSDVSILYADVVNYTHLTTTLTVEKLVTTLHDLYARFDLAAQHYRVQRIKFLGDCYYCVAGLTDPDPDHANNAVALGIAMIAHIQEVRASQNLDINMRIGIHSGTLYAGVIGESKLQFDVWGPDVTIANVLESTGVPGAVHISEAVLRNLTARNEYTIERGPERAQRDSLLLKNRIVTYLIVFPHNVPDFSTDDQMFSSSQPSSNLPHGVTAEFNEELREEYRKMPVMKYLPSILWKFWCQEPSKDPLNSQMDICLTFYDTDLEKPYLGQSDFLSRYYFIMAWSVGAGSIYIQIMNSENIELWCLVVDSLMLVFLTVMVFILWYKKICWILYGKKNKPHTYNRLSCLIFRIHEKIQESLTIRICTFLLVISLYWIIMGISTRCSQAKFILAYIEERIYHYEANQSPCFAPWETTSMLALMTCMAFTFSHIPFMLKTIVAFIQVLIYNILIFLQFDFVFHHSITSNPYFPSEYSHAFVVIITFVTMYLKAKQTEFCKRVNFSWRVELEKKRYDASITNSSITILLNNILPSHVVDIYLNSLAKNELYYENYKMVSVMFAMLSNFEMNLSSLRILNEVITQFDLLLLHYKKHYVVEKIKIANYTYIAACGLDVNFAGSTSKPLKLGSMKEERLELVSKEDHEEVVFVMASFALDLMRTLASCNKAYNGIVQGYNLSDGMITIGISSGEIMAGIVGASKPHYDIWGDPVNMAARMETTGQSGHIHVTEESANILESYGIQANYRGQTFVKGRGFLPTYFLGIDKDHNFITKRGTRQLSLAV
ncbi:adenylyl cyclase X E-like [Drosophila kikkawai]|uniref:adenylate cyclase n=1 Tax=Drosophila kikkawai TaxID=30033 RepID=A0ABM3C6N7_DROKI|nr:adenylyl cyclase X E-like [Drosophila kikkawai]